MAKKHRPTTEQIKNDPSLRWSAYGQWETVWSDVHNAELRFVRYEDGMVRLATLGGIEELSILVRQDQVRRASVMHDYQVNRPSEEEKNYIVHCLVESRKKNHGV